MIKRRHLHRLLLACLLGRVVALGLSFLPGRTNSSPSSHLPKDLGDFIAENGAASILNWPTFVRAWDAQVGRDYATARQLYNKLLAIYQNSGVIQYNLRLMASQS